MPENTSPTGKLANATAAADAMFDQREGLDLLHWWNRRTGVSLCGFNDRADGPAVVEAGEARICPVCTYLRDLRGQLDLPELNDL